MSGETGWTERGAHLHHALGTFQVWNSGPDSGLDRGLGSARISGALGAHLDYLEPRPPQARGQGPELINYHCACKVVGWSWP